MTETPATGRCNCGAVRFEVARPLRDIVVCHCSLCRRNGSNAGAYTSAPAGALRVLADDGLALYLDPNGRERSFCRLCGSTLFWAEQGSDTVSIAAGTLDGETGLRIAHHVYVDSAADWEAI